MRREEKRREEKRREEKRREEKRREEKRREEKSYSIIFYSNDKESRINKADSKRTALFMWAFSMYTAGREKFSLPAVYTCGTQ